MAKGYGVGHEEAAKIVATLPAPSQDEASEVIELMAELEPVIGLAVACSSKLAVASAGMAGSVIMGFDADWMKLTAKWTGVKLTKQRGRDLLALEDEIVAIFNERRAQ